MEKCVNKETKESLEDLINYIKSTDDYKKVIELKKEIDKDKELKQLISEVKKIQKEYVRSNFDDKVKEKLDIELNLLNSNKLFVTYTYHLDKVNDMIKLVKDELNNYFYEITNIL
jgi:cell fate (sporulation/competence/biofilm development) regulator YlbF (YheA/YmcA/DUF963 family)